MITRGATWMAAQDGGDRRGVRNRGETRRKVVVLQRVVERERDARWPTVSKFHQVGAGRDRETIGRQMAPRKASGRAKMAAVALRIQNSNEFSDRVMGVQNRQGARHPAVAMGHVADHVTTPTDSVNHFSQRIDRSTQWIAEQGWSEPREPGRRRDSTGAGMRSRPSRGAGGPSSDRVLASGQQGPSNGPTFVMVSVLAVTARGQRSGNDRAGSSPGLRSCQIPANFVSSLNQE